MLAQIHVARTPSQGSLQGYFDPPEVNILPSSQVASSQFFFSFHCFVNPKVILKTISFNILSLFKYIMI